MSKIKQLLIDNNIIDDQGNYNFRSVKNKKEIKQIVEDSVIGNFTTFQEKIWAIINDKEVRPVCEVCGKDECSFDGVNKGYKKTCSLKCGVNHISAKEKKERTNFERYGGHFMSHSEQTRAKFRNADGTWKGAYGSEQYKNLIKEKYGVDNIFQHEGVKEKIKQTNLERYGVENPQQCEQIKLQVVKTNLERYSCEYVLQNEEVKEKIKQTNLERYGAENPQQNSNVKLKVVKTNLQKYGVSCTLQSLEVKEKIKQTNLERYGAENPQQNEHINYKSRLKRMELYKGEILPIRLNHLKETFSIIPLNWSVNDYAGANKYYSFFHEKCNKSFEGKFDNGGVPMCPHCSINRSQIEQKLANSLEEIFNDVEISNRTIIKPKEIDIVIKNVGIEVNGIYWHRNGDKLLEKTELAKQQNIFLLHFWDTELYNKFDICKSIICAKLNRFETKIYARKCKLINISPQEAESFFNKNHLQGHTKAGYYLGLEYNGEIIQALSIGKPRFNKRVDYELHRLATKMNTTVIGGTDRLFKQVKRDFGGFKLISYADKRYSEGNVYKRLGFEEMKDSSPNYYWVKNTTILTRYQCQKHKLKILLGDNFNNELSETDNMINNGYYKIEDCGNKVFILNC